MKLAIEPIRIETAHPFQIARGTRKEYEVFVVTLTSDGVEGRGEAAPQPFYGENAMSVRAAIQSIGRLLDVEPEAARANLNTEGSELFERLRPHASVRAAFRFHGLLDAGDDLAPHMMIQGSIGMAWRW